MEKDKIQGPGPHPPAATSLRKQSLIPAGGNWGAFMGVLPTKPKELGLNSYTNKPQDPDRISELSQKQMCDLISFCVFQLTFEFKQG